jgi:hypothetical protein
LEPKCDFSVITVDIPARTTDPPAEKPDVLLTKGSLRSIFRTSASPVQDIGADGSGELPTQLDDNPAPRRFKERIAAQAAMSARWIRSAGKPGSRTP